MVLGAKEDFNPIDSAVVDSVIIVACIVNLVLVFTSAVATDAGIAAGVPSVVVDASDIVLGTKVFLCDTDFA